MEYDGFEWDEFNAIKIFEKHGVVYFEVEQVFINGPLIYPDLKHSQDEQRFLAFGKTNDGRWLTVAFTLRKHGKQVLIRPISSRSMHKKEKILYEEIAQKNSKNR